MFVTSGSHEVFHGHFLLRFTVFFGEHVPSLCQRVWVLELGTNGIADSEEKIPSVNVHQKR
jgi:hypothetical protein